jgi:hypothetical protein
MQLGDAVSRKAYVATLDVKSAFLQSEIDKEIYLKPFQGIKLPAGMQLNDVLLKLRKSMYGLKQAPKLWGDDLRKHLLEDLHFRQSQADPCLYIHDSEVGYLTISTWVDDIVCVYTNPKQWEMFVQDITNRFPISSSGKIDRFLGMTFRQAEDRSWIEIDQTKYIDELVDKYNLTEADCTRHTTPARQNAAEHIMAPSQNESQCEKTKRQFPYRQLIGGLQYAHQWTRPDIGTVLSMLARHQNNYTETHYRHCLNVLKYLKNTKDKCIRFSCDSDADRDLVGYVDSGFAGDPSSSKSRTGLIMFCANGPIIWRSALQSIVAQSSTEAEYIAANAIARECEWARLLHSEIVCPQIEAKPVKVFEDNQGCLALAKNFMITKRSKHIRIKYHYVRQQVKDKIIEMEYVNTKNNIADIFTKILAYPVFAGLSEKIVKNKIFGTVT